MSATGTVLAIVNGQANARRGRRGADGAWHWKGQSSCAEAGGCMLALVDAIAKAKGE